MDWRHLPPLAALRAFSAFAQGGSVVAAGAALGVSHAAVSQQLRALEAHLGVPLLDRRGRAMTLTAEGQMLAQACADGFDTIAAAIADVTGAEATRPLHISPTPSFAAAWLMPRLSAFRAAHPDVNLVLDPTPELVALAPGGVDAAIRFGQGDWEGLVSTLLVETPMVVVAAPPLLQGIDPTDPSRFAALPWLEEFGTSESTRWLDRHGLTGMARGPLTQVPGNLMLDGARDGQGVAVTVRAFVEADIQAGRLVVLHEDGAPGMGYHLVVRPGVQRPPLRAFARWIARVARADLGRPDHKAGDVARL